MEWVDAYESQVSNTSWAVLALLIAKCPEHEAIKRGCRLIMSRQRSDGRWLPELTVSRLPLRMSGGSRAGAGAPV